MSDQTEAPCDSSYRRFRSEYRGKRWLAQKILRDNHGRTKREQQRERSDSLCSQRELRRADLEMRRKAMREEKEEQKIARGAAKRAADDELEKEAFAYLAHPLKSLPGKDKQRREESLKRELKDMYTRKATSVKRSRQPNQLLKTLLKEAAEVKMELSVAAFTPTEEDIKSEGVRRVYSDVPLDYDEEEVLEEFRTFAEQKGLSIPTWADDQHRIILRILDTVGRNCSKAMKALKKHEQWRNSEIPVPSTEVSALLREGIVYTFGRDRSLRPVIVIRGEKVVRGNVQPNELLRLCYYVLEYVKATKLVPGKIETWVIVLDLANVPLDQTPVSAFKSVMKALKRHYCCTLHRMFVLNASSLITGIWMVVQFFLESVTRKKILICGEDFRLKITGVVPEDQLEQRYGGTCADLTSTFEPTGEEIQR